MFRKTENASDGTLEIMKGSIGQTKKNRPSLVGLNGSCAMKKTLQTKLAYQKLFQLPTMGTYNNNDLTIIVNDFA